MTEHVLIKNLSLFLVAMLTLMEDSIMLKQIVMVYHVPHIMLRSRSPLLCAPSEHNKLQCVELIKLKIIPKENNAHELYCRLTQMTRSYYNAS